MSKAQPISYVREINPDLRQGVIEEINAITAEIITSQENKKTRLKRQASIQADDEKKTSNIIDIKNRIAKL